MTRKNCAVSIIIPVFNSEKYLNKCIDSILDQTFQNYEILAINDGSTDSSRKILEEYKKKYPNKLRIFDKENGGQSSARNLALQHIKGEYTTFLDSDDYYEKTYLETLYSAARNHDSDMVISGQKKVDEDGTVRLNIDYKIDQYPDCILRRLNFSGKLYRTQYMQKHHMHFATGKTYEDNPFNLVMIFLARNLVILPYSGYYQVGHAGSTTTKKIEAEKLPLKEIKDAVIYIKKHEKEINDFYIYEFTLLSFFTYFIFQANKKHMYLNIEDRKSDIAVIHHLCIFVQNLLDTHFDNYWKNPHIGIFKHRELQLTQRIGVFIFVKLCRFHMLKWFAGFYYQYF